MGEIARKPLQDGFSPSRRIFVTLINVLEAQWDRSQRSSIPSGSPVRAGAEGDRIGVTDGTLACTHAFLQGHHRIIFSALLLCTLHFGKVQKLYELQIQIFLKCTCGQKHDGDASEIKM